MRTRKGCHEFRDGDYSVVSCDRHAVLAHRYQLGKNSLLAGHNLSDQPQKVTLKVPDITRHQMLDLLENQIIDHIKGPAITLDLARYSVHWYRLAVVS